MPAKEPKIPQIMRQTAERSLNDGDVALQARVAAFKAAGEPVFERGIHSKPDRLSYWGKRPAGACEEGPISWDEWRIVQRSWN